MSESKHTPGPWEVSKDATPDYAPQCTVYDESGERVATAFQCEANAALIAAAPDLVLAANNAATAIRMLLEYTIVATRPAAEMLYQRTGENFDAILAELDAALARAEGR